MKRYTTSFIEAQHEDVPQEEIGKTDATLVPDDFVVTDEFIELIHKIYSDRICVALKLDDAMANLMRMNVRHLLKSEVEAVLEALRQ